MWKRIKEKGPVIAGLYGGVMLGAVVMMIAGGLGYTKLADLSLILGICAGPSIGWIAGKIAGRKADAAKKDGGADAPEEKEKED